MYMLIAIPLSLCQCMSSIEIRVGLNRKSAHEFRELIKFFRLGLGSHFNYLCLKNSLARRVVYKSEFS